MFTIQEYDFKYRILTCTFMDPLVINIINLKWNKLDLQKLVNYTKQFFILYISIFEFKLTV